MSTKQIYLSGTAKWAKVQKPDQKYGHYGVDLSLDNESQRIFDESGCKLQPKKDEIDKKTYYTFKRKPEQKIGEKTIQFGAPTVLDSDGKTPFTGLIGNGSKLTILVSVYDIMKGKSKGHRLEKVRVDELIPFGDSGPVEPELPPLEGDRF